MESVLVGVMLVMKNHRYVFLMHIDNMFKCVSCGFKMFADDTTCFTRINRMTVCSHFMNGIQSLFYSIRLRHINLQTFELEGVNVILFK